DPRDLAHARTERSHHVRHRDVHDARVDDAHDHAEHHDGGDGPRVRRLVPGCTRIEGHGAHGVAPATCGSGAPPLICTVADKPAGTDVSPSSRIRTGTRCTTLMKFPVALSGGSSENTAPVPGEMLS